MHDHNCFLTLTYDDEHLPEHSQLVHRDFQLFLKRARAARTRKNPNLLGRGKILYYMAGEYGSGDNTERPHYHACIFNLDFADKEYFTTRQDNDIWTSKTLTELWQQGHSSIGAISFESAAYVARYVMKKVTGDKAKEHYQRLDTETGELYSKTAEYNQMSKGIGKSWIDKFMTDVYPHGKTVVNAHQVNAPRYYDKQFTKLDEQTFQDITQHARQKKGQQFAADQTDERRAVRAKVLSAKLKFLRRDL